MQRIERYGVLALVFLLVTLVTFALWDDESKPGNKEVAKAGPAKEAPVRQLSPAERQQREALRRREEANRELERRRAQDQNKGLSPKEKYQSGKTAAELAEERRRNEARKSFAKTDKPVIDGQSAAGAGLQIGMDDGPRSGRDAGTRGPSAPADLDRTPTNNPSRETEADKRRRAREEMDRMRRQGEHVVAKGETLSQISMERLGTTRRMQEIVALNPGIDPDHLVIGQKLILPGGGSAAVVAPEPKTAPRSTPAGPGGTYTIRSGDVLSRIAQDQLGSIKYVQAILDVNPGLEPTQLSVGQVIAMPAGAKRNDVASTPRRTSSTSSSKSDRPRVR
jgi:LysM repeat protein